METTAEYIAARLRAHPAVHSVNSRIKHPAHLLEKVVRKRLAKPARAIDRKTYSAQITDLIGIRVLHLFKGDWFPIHKYISAHWDLPETPTANIRKGDSEPLVSAFREAGCAINEHEMGYRSIHYVVKSQPARRMQFAELQVRTIFEEGWSEIDHRIRYPYNLDNAVLNQFLAVFNSLAGSADEMGTFIQTLRGELEAWESQRSADATAHAKTVSQLKAQVETLSIDAKAKRKLEERVKELERSRSDDHRVTIGGASTAPSGIRYIGAAAHVPAVLNTGPSATIFGQNSLPGAYTVPRSCERCGAMLFGATFTNEKLCLSCRMSSPIGSVVRHF